MKNILLWIWQFPQNILGLILILLTKARKWEDRLTGIVFYYVNSRGDQFGVSLGNYIILRYPIKNVIKHEHGHQIQSMLFGPLYLFVVGIPSILMAGLSILSYQFFSKKFAKNYYKRWPESWADKLGNVERD